MAASIELLERDAELATIERVLNRAAAGEGRLLAIEGEAGAGKTSLLDAVAQIAATREMTVLRARGGEYERDFPYGVVRQLFEPLFSGEDRRAELLAGTAAMAAPIFGGGATAQVGTDQLGAQHGLYWLVADLAAAGPLVLSVDDAQWADLASLRALAYIARRLESMSAALVVTVRTGEPCEHSELLDALRGEPHSRAITPPPLSAGAAASLVASEIGSQPTERFAEACCAATAGNPLLMVELLQAFEHEGAAPTDENAERLTQVAAAGVSDSILARLGRLGEHSVEVARAVAVLEPNAELRTIAALVGLPVASVAEECERLIRARLLFDSRPLGFVHPLVRAAVLSDISLVRQATAHAEAAHLLADDGAASDTVAAHLLLAEPAGEAWVVEQLRAAAASALGRGGVDAGVRYLRRALREPPARDRRPSVSHELGAALLRANDPEGLEVLRTVRAATEDPLARAAIVTELANSLGIRNGCEEAAKLIEESLSEVADPQVRLGLRGYLLMMLVWGLEWVPEGALPDPDEAFDNDTLADRMALGTIATLCALGLEPIERGRELAERLRVDREGFTKDAMAGFPAQGMLATLTLTDRGNQSEDLFEQAIEAARRRGSMVGVAGGHGIRGFCRFYDGSLREAQADIDIAVPLVHRFGLLMPLSLHLSVAVKIQIARGEFSAAEQLLADFWQGKPVAGSSGSLLLCARGELRQATGRHAEARHDFLAAAKRVSWLPYLNPELHPWRTGLASCEAALGNGEEARRLVDEAVELARQAGGTRGIGITLRVSGVLNQGTEGIEQLREAVDLLGETRSRLQYAQALVDLGAALRRANQRKEARGPLRKGLDLAHRCGSELLEERARTELEASGARSRKAVLSGIESLTPSELRIARMASEGMTNREIAQSLFVTPKTVETHLRHAYQKLDVAKRTELASALADDSVSGPAQ